MKLRIAHIGDLRDMCFNIPDYQRGYRWETKQVCELLDDLLEFYKTKNDTFYCLQPLVVVENCKNLCPGEKVFDVIDGQQRLTTIFLISNYINKGQAPYRLRYDRASDKNSSVCFENGELSYRKLESLTDGEIEKNPDFFYLSRAIKDIEHWFVEYENTYPKIRRMIENVIMSDDYEASDAEKFYDKKSDDDKNVNQKDVRFIWYDATDNTIYQGSISVFKRLNYGKTSLTAADLIKALLFQCDVYKSVQRAERRQVAFRMSTEWDRMEKELQNPFVYSMLVPEKKDKISNIDFVLSYVASQLVENNNLRISSSINDDDYDYIVFDKYIRKKLEEGKNYAEIVDYLWQEVQNVFDIILSWYNERELYHLIGLRLTLLNPKNKKRTEKERSEYNKTLREMLEHFLVSKSMNEFKDEQKSIIGDLLSIEKYNKNLKEGAMPITLANLEYGTHDDELIKILLAYNVTLCMKNSQDNQYFPFWFYQKITPSLEHIHPQHLHDEDISFDVRCQWYSEKRKELKRMELIGKKKEDIDKACAILDNVLQLTEKEINGEDNNSYKNKKNDYETNEGIYRKELEKIDKLFDELANINSSELHSIRNMALVDKDTNAALGNGLMASKRQKLLERQTLFNESNGEKGAYTFIGTWKVFNKQFLDVEKDDLKTPNLLFWSKKDRDNYFADLETIYNGYKNK